jgi:hypothetical protein
VGAGVLRGSGPYTVHGRALWTPARRGLHFALLCVARDFRRCDHNYPRWGGHITDVLIFHSHACSAHRLLS